MKVKDLIALLSTIDQEAQIEMDFQDNHPRNTCTPLYKVKERYRSGINSPWGKWIRVYSVVSANNVTLAPCREQKTYGKPVSYVLNFW